MKDSFHIGHLFLILAVFIFIYGFFIKKIKIYHCAEGEKQGYYTTGSIFMWLFSTNRNLCPENLNR